MPKKAKSKGIGKRAVGGGSSKKKLNKRSARSGFEQRHIDQVHLASQYHEGIRSPYQHAACRLFFLQSDSV